ncbi:MAG: hypothetical protein GY811_07035 [Myxococcales bacterium]|nr:hypothetical protein [Myxococcales bacterium]
MVADTTNATGEFVLAGVPSGESSVLARWPGESSAFYYLRSGDAQPASTGDELRFEIEPPGSVRARIRLSDGTAPKDAWLSIGRFAAEAASFAPPIGSLNGVVKLEKLPPGTYVQDFFGPEFQSTFRKNVLVQAGKATELGNIVVDGGRRISGTVYDASGDVAVGAHVFAMEKRFLDFSEAAIAMLP